MVLSPDPQVNYIWKDFFCFQVRAHSKCWDSGLESIFWRTRFDVRKQLEGAQKVLLGRSIKIQCGRSLSTERMESLLTPLFTKQQEKENIRYCHTKLQRSLGGKHIQTSAVPWKTVAKWYNPVSGSQSCKTSEWTMTCWAGWKVTLVTYSVSFIRQRWEIQRDIFQNVWVILGS